MLEGSKIHRTALPQGPYAIMLAFFFFLSRIRISIVYKILVFWKVFQLEQKILMWVFKWVIWQSAMSTISVHMMGRESSCIMQLQRPPAQGSSHNMTLLWTWSPKRRSLVLCSWNSSCWCLCRHVVAIWAELDDTAINFHHKYVITL